MKIKVIGCDPSFTHFGLALATVDLDTLDISPIKLDIHITEKQKGSVARDDLRRCLSLHQFLKHYADGVKLIISEVPTGGSKSHAAAKAMSYATCLLACTNRPIVPVTPLQVKECVTGDKYADKDAMMAWAMETYPYLDWPTVKYKKEHMSDALASIHAGVQTLEFQEITNKFL